jgi:hypothetical protein
MFLAHHSNTSIDRILEMDGQDIGYWYTEAVNNHNRLNKRDE